MRTIHSSIYYPQVFFAYFTLFHIYYFSCPFGFSYAALASTALFQLHSMIFFWNRYELPAIVNGQISSERPRMTLHHQDENNQRRSGNEQNHIRHELSRTSPRTSSDTNISPYNTNIFGSASSFSTGQEIQRMRSSYPSMSNLGGRISSYDGYWTSLDGEVS